MIFAKTTLALAKCAKIHQRGNTILCDGRDGKMQRWEAAPASRGKNNGILDRIECGRVRKLRTAKNAEKSKKPGNRGEWLERGARISAPYYEKLFWRVVRYV